MKKTLRILLIIMMLAVVVFTLWACDDKNKTGRGDIAAPTDIATSGSTISWSAVEGATSYELIVEDTETSETTNLSTTST